MSALTSGILYTYSQLFDATYRLLAYLNSPPPSSWVVRVAASFRILAAVIIFPWICLTLLDVASYMIVRTLGADSAHRAGTTQEANGLTLSFDDESSQTPKTPYLVPSHISVTRVDGTTEPEPYLSEISTSSEGSAALSGEGIFSPPASRPNSPPILGHHNGSCRDELEVPALRKRT